MAITRKISANKPRRKPETVFGGFSKMKRESKNPVLLDSELGASDKIIL